MMRRKLKSLVVASMFLGLSSCAHSIHQVHTSDFIPYGKVEQGEVVTAKAEQFVVLGFASETNYVNQAYTKLMASCPNGKLSGITTQLSTSLGFFSWTNVAFMRGLCLN
jgi:hypothetical protein